jgi:endonuclease YncB( thermonuclease family)
MRKFYLQYPKSQAPGRLPWTHYQLLSTVSDDSVRTGLEKKAIKESLSSRELEALIVKGKKVESDEPVQVKTLSQTPGVLWTYVVHDVTKVSESKNRVVIDCGFNVLREYYTDKIFKTGDCVRLEKRESASARSVLKKIPLSKLGERYMYVAVVEKVIDGDTLWVSIDTGMGVLVRQKLRLRAIDAPELQSKDGQRAKLFVSKQLQDCPFIVIRTAKSDKYDRYLADVYYQPREKDPTVVAQEGTFLNQALCNESLARVV